MQDIRTKQIEQGFEACFATTRIFEDIWTVDNCLRCCYKIECLREMHSTIVLIRRGVSILPDDEQMRIVNSAINSPQVRAISQALELAKVPVKRTKKKK